MLPQSVTPIFSVGEIEVTYKNNQNRPLTPVVTSRTAFNILFESWSCQINRIEEVYMLCLDQRKQVIGLHRVAMGGFSSALADPKVIFQTALACNASSFILAHNHPSGSLEPSDADVSLTNRLRDLGKLLTLPLIDHIILSPEQTYYSFADQGRF